MKKKFRVVKNFKIVKRSCSLNRYYRVTDSIKKRRAWPLLFLIESVTKVGNRF